MKESTVFLREILVDTKPNFTHLSKNAQKVAKTLLSWYITGNKGIYIILEKGSMF